jgi:putative PIN family toxin of toxin-antitoxin system
MVKGQYCSITGTVMKVDSFVTKEIIDEYIETIDYLKDKYKDKNINIPINHIISSVHCIESKTKIDICRDPDDNKFIECAMDGKCVYIVSGDKDLLTIGEIENIEIVTVSEFLNKYNS